MQKGKKKKKKKRNLDRTPQFDGFLLLLVCLFVFVFKERKNNRHCAFVSKSILTVQFSKDSPQS